ncbi:MAG: lipid biosynthesis acyltransferase [Betaproteobacteria bacterium]|nr:lipid biosynthesis acyltransferase [Betaproteobacteria bacterium]
MLKFLFLCASRLPLALLHAAGAAAGAVAYRLSPALRRQIDANMTQAGYPEPAMHRAAARETGKAIAEMPAIWLRPLEQVAGLVRDLQGWEQVAEAQAQGRPIVFLTPHLGCFELTAQAYAWHTRADKPLTVLYRPPRKAVLAPLIQAGRNRPNMRVAAVDLAGVRALMRALKNGESAGLLPDQAPRFGEGVWAPFFGRPAFTMTLVQRLARAGRAVIFLASAERLPRAAGYRLVIEPFDEALSKDPTEAATQINRALETLIRRLPTQYLWAYNRYKVPPGVAQPPVIGQPPSDAQPPGPAQPPKIGQPPDIGQPPAAVPAAGAEAA